MGSSVKRVPQTFYLILFQINVRDLFNDTAAMLDLLYLRSIIGCPGCTRSAFTRAFRAKRELQCIFLGER